MKKEKDERDIINTESELRRKVEIASEMALK
jgi:hypothetical protein